MKLNWHAANYVALYQCNEIIHQIFSKVYNKLIDLKYIDKHDLYQNYSLLMKMKISDVVRDLYYTAVKYEQ